MATMKQAASVLLVRDNDAKTGIEVFMQHRATTMPFAAGTLAFPGGGVSAADHLASEKLGTALDVITAIREMFEETGLWLGTASRKRPAKYPTIQDIELRGMLHTGDVRLDEIVRLAPLSPSNTALTLGHRFARLGRWVTPDIPATAHESRHYDVQYFIAQHNLDQGQPDGNTSEAVATCWISPQEALAQHKAGEIKLHPATWWHLTWLAEHRKASMAINAGRVAFSQEYQNENFASFGTGLEDSTYVTPIMDRLWTDPVMDDYRMLADINGRPLELV